MSSFRNATAAEVSQRSQWPASKGRLSEMEGEEPDISPTTTVEERFAMMWQLAQDAWAFRGEPIAESPFSRPAVRIDQGAVQSGGQTEARL